MPRRKKEDRTGCSICNYQAWHDAQKSFKKTIDIDRDPTSYGNPVAPSKELENSAKAGCLGCCVLIKASDYIHQSWTSQDYEERPSELYVSSEKAQTQASVLWVDTGGTCRGLYIFTVQDQPVIPGLAAASKKPRSTHLAHSLPQIESWLTTCRSKHDKCADSENYTPPRLLDLEAQLPKGAIVLVETADLAQRLADVSLTELQPTHRYICLSHCWGETVRNNPRTTTTLSRAANKHSIPIRDLPQTFQDAIEASRALGYRYLWIDSLCIIQDDGADWRSHVTEMTDIYRCADMTLAAGASANGDGGLFRTVPSDPNLSRCYEIEHPQGKYQVYIRDWPLHGYQFLGMTGADWPLMKRGWVLQEYLLSRRFINFGPEEVTWTCNTDSHCSCEVYSKLARFDDDDARWFWWGDIFKHDLAKVKRGNLASARDVWERVVECYTRLRLTQISDRLPAIAGIARYFQRLNGDVYLSGLWKADLKAGLSWYLGSGLYTELPTLGRARPGPSWTWTSAAADMTVFTGRHPIDDDAFDIVDIQVVRDHDDEFSDIVLGTLTITGRLLPISITMSGGEDGYYESFLEEIWTHGSKSTSDYSQVFFEQDFRLGETLQDINKRLTRVIFLPISCTDAYGSSQWKLNGLVLVEATAASASQLASYERIGFLSYHLIRSANAQRWDGYASPKVTFQLV